MNAYTFVIAVIVAFITGCWAGDRHADDARWLTAIAGIVILVLVGVVIGTAIGGAA